MTAKDHTQSGIAGVMINGRRSALCDFVAALIGVAAIEIVGMYIALWFIPCVRNFLLHAGVVDFLSTSCGAIASTDAVKTITELSYIAFVRMLQAVFLMVLFLMILRRGTMSIGLHIANFKRTLAWSATMCCVLAVIAALCGAICKWLLGFDFFLVCIVGSPDRALIAPIYLIWVLFVTAFLGPFVEEMFFRGVLYRCTRALISFLPAIALSATVFALLHATHGGLPLIQFTGGIVFAYVYEKTGNIFAPWLVHAAGNAAMILLHLFYI